MIVGAFIKGLFLYFAFIAIRGVWRSYKMFDSIKQQASAHAGAQTRQSAQPSQNQPNDVIVEAEFRHID